MQTIKRALKQVEERLDSLSIPRVSEADVNSLRQAVTELAKDPVYRTWEDVHGNFPRVENLFAAFMITKGNVSTGEQVLAQKQFDRLELLNGKCFRGLAWGKTANNANVKTIRFRVIEGQYNTVIATFTPSVSQAGHWSLAFRILRVSDVAIFGFVAFIVGPTNAIATLSTSGQTGADATTINPLTLQITGEGTATNDVTMEGTVIPRIESTLETFGLPLVGNVGVGEDTLAEKILRTNELISNGQSIRGVYWGTTANNANAKTLRLRVIEGANNSILISNTLTVSELGQWTLAFEILRIGATTLLAVGQCGVGPLGTTQSRSVINVSQITATLANAVTLRLTGEAVSDNDIIRVGGLILPPVNTISTVQATVGNITTGEDTLAETILGASGAQFNISADGMTIRGIYWGHTANNANVKTIRARLIEGANNTILVSGATLINELGCWALAFEITRFDASTLRCIGQVACGPANSNISFSGDNVTQPPATLANAITIRITGDATATNDITVEGGSLSFVP